MKKLISLLTLTIPLLCLGMEEPSGSSNPTYQAFLSATRDGNIPQLCALTAASKGTAESGEALIALSGFPEVPDNLSSRELTVLPLEIYKNLASQLCPTCNEQDIAAALESAVHASPGKVHLLLELSPQQLSPQSLNIVMRSFLLYNPLWEPFDKTDNDQNAAILQDLINAGAYFSPENASFILKTLLSEYPPHNNYNHCKQFLPLLLSLLTLEPCNPERRALMRILKERGGQAPACTGHEPCGAYCDSLIAGVNKAPLHDICQTCRTMDSDARMSLCAGCMLGSLGAAAYPQVPAACCCLLCATQALPSSRAIQIYKTALQTEPAQQAVPMNAEPAPQPAHLGQDV